MNWSHQSNKVHELKGMDEEGGGDPRGFLGGGLIHSALIVMANCYSSLSYYCHQHWAAG